MLFFILFLFSDNKNQELTIPDFISEQNVSLTGKGKLLFFLPDPNSDGWDRFGTSQLAYRIQLVVGCDVVADEIVVEDVYPFQYEMLASTPRSDYQIYISRYDATPSKMGSSPNVIISGPASSSASSGIPEDYTKIDRFIMHVPKVSGGFRGTLLLENKFPDLPSVIWVAGFDGQGNFIPGTKQQVLIVGALAKLPIYPDNSGSSLYPVTYQDQVAYMGLREDGNKNLVQVSITYTNNAGDPFPATLSETKLNDGFNVGSVFTVDGRKSDNYWDGAALLNLSSQISPNLDLVYRRISDGSEIDRKSIGTVQPGQKVLAVLSDYFPFSQETYYSLESPEQDQTFQVLGLRGAYQQSILVGSSVSLKQ